MLFEELENYVNKLNQQKNDNYCLICNFGNENECVKLECNHFYHTKCLKKLKKCPYCNKKVSILQKDIKQNKTNKLLCSVILKTGKRKGQVCGRTNCRYHKKLNQ